MGVSHDNGGTEVFASDADPHRMHAVGSKVKLTHDAHEEHGPRGVDRHTRVGQVVHTHADKPQGADKANHKTFHIVHVKWPSGKVTQHMHHELEAHS
jgi:hypothetical protein